MTERAEHASPTGAVEFLNPDGLSKNPAFTQVVVANRPARTNYIGAQDAVDASGAIVGKGNIRAQTEQTMMNLKVALQAAEAGPEHVIKWIIYVVQGQPIQAAFEAGMRVWWNRPNPPANTVMFVPAFAHPDFLVTIEAVAVMPQ